MVEVAGQISATADLEPGDGVTLATSDGKYDDLIARLRPRTGLW
ncbi:MAG: hypothetical protein R3A79_03240 [Nannocystaceae bacterium]